ncbi:MAG: DEAD/DEAH box helicase [Verrucomicrobiales bacterium]|nr:DEAD/DEAH box helicase [Verrucomicrobiales bacterium]
MSANVDRATLDFLNKFSEDERNEGQRLHNEGAVAQIFGNHLIIQGKVEDSTWSCRTKIQLQGNQWVGTADDKSESGKAALYATMLEKIERKGDIPESPNEVGERSLTEILEEKLGRLLSGEEDEYLNKLERRYRRFEISREIFDSDIVRLQPRWPIDGFEPLTLWPETPSNILEFWNYLSHAFRKGNFDYPDFMESITDREWTEGKMREWEREREISEWKYQVDVYNKRPNEDTVEMVEFRLRLTNREARLMWKSDKEEQFNKVDDEEVFDRLKERYAAGGLRMDAGSEILWSKFLRAAAKEDADDGGLILDNIQNCRLLNRLFHQPEIEGRIVNLDEIPFTFVKAPLSWESRVSPNDPEEYVLQLVTAEGIDVSHTMRLLPGDETIYLSDETAFPGPEFWNKNETLIDPFYEIPSRVIETENGVAFLHRLGVQLPESLEKRVKEEELTVTLDLRIDSKATGASSDHMLIQAIAENSKGTRKEILGREGWEVVEQQDDDGATLYRYDRRVLRGVGAVIAPMQPTYDANRGCYRVRVTKNFPEKYAEWRANFPDDITVIADPELSTLEADPIEAQVTFDVVDQNIDWFDLKVVVKVEGMDLTEEEIRALVQARGQFVKMDRGGWLRLEMNLDKEQRDAVSRIGLDPFDLTGEVHRMHALQLAEPLAKEVFDAKSWKKITERAESLKLQVRPDVPAGLNVNLRPYQFEGFHFLSYISTNNFGGILADDMGLGKTIQTLTWLLWIREEAGDNPPPSLVVCPKSVLDVWGAEVKKAAPGINVQVLRNKIELEVDKLGTEIDLLVINYSQLRTCAEELKDVKWLAVILDEGQQIKNPDSKAAKSARALKGENRLVLTGTPIENRLLDVWSLMAFAMPGILGDRKYFRENFDRRKDALSQTRLSARLRPFLLRRTKGEVALDLPPKVEEDVYCEFEPAQQKLYNAELERIQKVLLGVESNEGLRKNSFVILQGLMRLRQICCHPGLADSKHLAEESSKMNALFYLLDQLHEEGHKVLVFSQFVSMLDLIRDELEERDRPISYLTGQTKNRHEVISDFQETKDPKTFLLSLKAGGSGLNLTSASYVILYDPWWNPAVENQAIDRCHRIGQESRVNAYRLLCRDSVEEKIRVLQQQKSEMMTGVLGEEGFTRNLEIDDLKFLFSMGKEVDKPEKELVTTK